MKNSSLICLLAFTFGCAQIAKKKNKKKKEVKIGKFDNVDYVELIHVGKKTWADLKKYSYFREHRNDKISETTKKSVKLISSCVEKKKPLKEIEMKIYGTKNKLKRYNNLGLCSYYRGNLSQAFYYFSRGLAEEEGIYTHILQNNLAVLFFRLGNPFEAISFFESIKEKHPVSALNMAEIYNSGKTFDLLGQTLGTLKNEKRIQADVGRITYDFLFFSEQYSEAVAHFQMMKKRKSPDDRQKKMYLASLSRMEDLTAARKFLESSSFKDSYQSKASFTQEILALRRKISEEDKKKTALKSRVPAATEDSKQILQEKNNSEKQGKTDSSEGSK